MIPWKEVAATISKVFTLTQEVQKIKADAKQTRDELEELERKVTHIGQQVNDLTFSFQRVYYETQRLQDEIRRQREDNERRDKDAARERDNLILRLENQLLRAERGLPPAKRKIDLFLLFRLPQLFVNFRYNHSSVARGMARQRREWGDLDGESFFGRNSKSGASAPAGGVWGAS